jgi:protein phosphatase
VTSRDEGSTTAPAQTLPRQLARVHGPQAVTVAWGVSSDIGKVRTVNEDATCVVSPVFAVADGMGGYDAGYLAARLAVGALGGFEPGQAVNATALRGALASANSLIFECSGRGARAMGTTVSGLAFTSGRTSGRSPTVTVFNVGDSRTYLYGPGRPRELRQVTRDHSHVQELYEAGEIAEDEMVTHPDRHIVTRALGIEPEVEVDVLVHAAEAGQRWLICSDGLTSELRLTEIRACLDADDAQSAADRLVAATLAGSARDNVSVVVVDVLGVDAGEDPERTDPRPRPGPGSPQRWAPALRPVARRAVG